MTGLDLSISLSISIVWGLGFAIAVVLPQLRRHAALLAVGFVVSLVALFAFALIAAVLQ